MRFSFTEQVKEGPKQEIYLNRTELQRLVDFAEASKELIIRVTGSETGIGMHLEVSDRTGAVIDITDYVSW